MAISQRHSPLSVQEHVKRIETRAQQCRPSFSTIRSTPVQKSKSESKAAYETCASVWDPDTPTYDRDLLDDLDDLDEEYTIAEATMIIATKSLASMDEVVKPTLPQRSKLRASALMTRDSLKLITTAAAATATATTTAIKPAPIQATAASPHDMYLSSEEDASSYSDGDSDNDYDSASEESRTWLAGGKKEEDLARVVSVIFSGKPCIVELPRSRSSSSPSPSPLGGRALKTCCSMKSTPDMSPIERKVLGPSRRSSFFSIERPLYSPSFLSTDPYAHIAVEGAQAATVDGAVAATATATAAVAPKAPTVFNRVSRTFSLVRKRSRPLLQNLNTKSAAATQSKPNLTLSVDRTSLAMDGHLLPPGREHTPATPLSAATFHGMPAKQHQGTKITKRPASMAMPPPPPRSYTQPVTPTVAHAPSSRKSLLSGLGLSRRKSIRL